MGFLWVLHFWRKQEEDGSRSLDEENQKSKLAVHFVFVSQLKPAAAAAAASLSWKDEDFDHMGTTRIGSARIQTRNLSKPAALQS